ncbi:antibiotic biosynthesis monooxygenase [Halobacillus litoralis]|uniref:Antibiotic biosynthesis monooxygenase n=1 Tax=Halobacillus litoralis TaxID=45668 RepID=A0A845DY56_9BACI|nr:MULTISPECIES: antibiotic biosynthesis monooxygenase [Halobacillus]MCA1022561.1 antibiotic biosynthesis monooxygenase [Halobacillus litoralis]MYL18394.1 antibiotic biosynthesis monooxygenase [Halobacillus litoralis]MYL30599.1 antibiotic biosynthesis monooxygenase [Halobacillus halophilus]MYL38616.1 antibiotic biosynthesis monooxygenase [Halobacillus litoralis]
MKVSMTSGTLDYLAKLREQHPDASIFYMQDQDKTLAYYEGDGPSIFSEGRDYETVDHVGDVQPGGYVVMNNIPVSEEGRPVFEDRFKQRAGNVENQEGFQAIRILRPLKGNTYVVFTQWRNQQDFEDWKSSKSFDDAHKKSGPKHAKKPSFIDGDAYITQYRMIQLED